MTKKPMEKESPKEGSKVLDAVLAQIRKEFGKAPSCDWETPRPQYRKFRSSRPAHSPSTSPWESAACRAAGSSRYSARNHRERPPSRCTSSQCPEAGGTAAFIDAEHAMDPGYAMKIGVNL